MTMPDPAPPLTLTDEPEAVEREQRLNALLDRVLDRGVSADFCVGAMTHAAAADPDAWRILLRVLASRLAERSR